MYEDGISFPFESFLAIAEVASRAMLDAVSKPRNIKVSMAKILVIT